jgi:hypothetical protein
MSATAPVFDLAEEYGYAEVMFAHERAREDDMEAVDHATQREITLGSLGPLRARRPGFHLFNELLVLYPTGGDRTPVAGVVPDNFVVLHDGPLDVDTSFRTSYQPAGPFLVMEYVSRYHEKKDYEDNRERYQDGLNVPYYLVFFPGEERLDLFRLQAGEYRPVPPDQAGRVDIPELELAAGVLDGWMRFWHRGELLPLPVEWEQRWDAARAERDAERAAERTARLALEAEVARLRAELAALRGSPLNRD